MGERYGLPMRTSRRVALADSPHDPELSLSRELDSAEGAVHRRL
jgi:hypothetical protein